MKKVLVLLAAAMALTLAACGQSSPNANAPGGANTTYKGS